MNDKIEGVPDGWRLVRIGKAKVGEWFIGSDSGNPVLVDGYMLKSVRVIIEKIEKPKQYRPFANAAEFEPHRDRWLMHPGEPDKRFKPGDYNNQGVWGLDRRHYDYQHLLMSGTLFDDGIPFGVEVTE